MTASPTFSDQLQTATQTIRAGLAPTNAEALALLDSFSSLPVDERDAPSLAAPLMTHRLRAHGYARKGDKFAGSTNATHYAKRYPDPKGLVNDLAMFTQAADDYVEANGLPTPIIVPNAALASAEPAALQAELDKSWTALAATRKLPGVGDIIRNADWERAMRDIAEKFAPIFDTIGRIGRMPRDIVTGAKMGAGVLLVLLLLLASRRRR